MNNLPMDLKQFLFTTGSAPSSKNNDLFFDFNKLEASGVEGEEGEAFAQIIKDFILAVDGKETLNEKPGNPIILADGNIFPPDLEKNTQSGFEPEESDTLPLLVTGSIFLSDEATSSSEVPVFFKQDLQKFDEHLFKLKSGKDIESINEKDIEVAIEKLRDFINMQSPENKSFGQTTIETKVNSAEDVSKFERSAVVLAKKNGEEKDVVFRKLELAGKDTKVEDKSFNLVQKESPGFGNKAVLEGDAFLSKNSEKNDYYSTGVKLDSELKISPEKNILLSMVNAKQDSLRQVSRLISGSERSGSNIETGTVQNIYSGLSVTNIGEQKAELSSVNRPAMEQAFPQGLNLRNNFASDLSLRVKWMFRQSLSSAEIMMDPPEMGPLSVKVHHTNGETSILFQVSQQTTKEVIDENLSKLREMLNQQGINIADTEVRHQQEESHSKDGKSTDELVDSIEEVGDENESSIVIENNALIDTYT
ncbi:flagellar hook-length control protein FliK [Aliikangiella sp. G2MR2-5]|uniref:flagellar hook-length control protein FliK n=1 Tax=Aliikangiella sp. G2MR2-5 TaxID=2788943 RepID=UPI0018AABD1B|nr:flagellar hook-length control protein FliK [Aliikangiella sp. G2MR2-5]